jgi:hypothetical protein
MSELHVRVMMEAEHSGLASRIHTSLQNQAWKRSKIGQKAYTFANVVVAAFLLVYLFSGYPYHILSLMLLGTFALHSWIRGAAEKHSMIVDVVAGMAMIYELGWYFLNYPTF